MKFLITDSLKNASSKIKFILKEIKNMNDFFNSLNCSHLLNSFGNKWIEYMFGGNFGPKDKHILESYSISNIIIL
jgi:hypothetical protein